MKIDRIDHVHVIVKDMDKAARFFSSILGSRFVGPIEYADHSVAFNSVGLELLCPKTSEPPRHMQKAGVPINEGLFSISLRVPNRDEAVAELEARGIRCNWKGNYPTLKTAQMHPADTYGVWLELVEYEPVAPIALANLGKTKEIPFVSELE